MSKPMTRAPRVPRGWTFLRVGSVLREGDRFHDADLGWCDTHCAGWQILHQEAGTYIRRKRPRPAARRGK